jgi:murein DD-endopeptidase MepM/ murein hydrolase activator NlpD
VDVDGDGQSDFMNPTGHAEREHDAYGSGQFGVSRDGGERRHEGVDYVSIVGQAVKAPMSGFVTRVGWAYEGDNALRTVEITNPALHYVARVLYVRPDVTVGQAVAMGQVIGHAQSLQQKYPGGMTNHVHLQIAPKGRAWMDCSRLIPEMRG